jgi:hypothetical protein
MYHLLKILDNTFVGTLLAGAILAWFGFSLYRKQKEVDIEYEELRKIRELASNLYVIVETASKKYEGQLNIHSGINSQLTNFFNLINNKFDSHFTNESSKEFNEISVVITKATDNLVAQLKIAGNYDEVIKVLIEKMPMINMCFIGSATLHLSKPDHIEDLRKLFNEMLLPVQESLQKLIKKS